MQVPIEIVFVVVFICFVGDMYRQSKIPRNNYEDGYRKALEDVASDWDMCVMGSTRDELWENSDRFVKRVQKRADEIGR